MPYTRHAAAAAGQPCQTNKNPKESPTAKTTLRSDQPRHPMVRRRATVGQTRLVIGPSDAAYPFCAGRVAVPAIGCRKLLPQHVGIVGFTSNRQMLSDHIGFIAVGPQVDEEEQTES